ncbi:MAG: hypothetical protein V1862_05435, partial [Methanobacteriota archaeon]
LNNKIRNNTRDLPLRAANSPGMVYVSDTPNDLPDHHWCRSAAREGDEPPISHPNNDPGLICREEPSARNLDPAARAASPSIDPGDYIAVEGWPQKKPCIICGRQYTHYQERMTPERITGPPRPNRMLCTGCYEAARVREALSVRTIPGVIDTGPMQHRSSPTGRCTVRNTGSAVWSDPRQQTSLCETCYNREQATARGES